jgi:hypothetical protein
MIFDLMSYNKTVNDFQFRWIQRLINPWNMIFTLDASVKGWSILVFTSSSQWLSLRFNIMIFNLKSNIPWHLLTYTMLGFRFNWEGWVYIIQLTTFDEVNTRIDQPFTEASKVNIMFHGLINLCIHRNWSYHWKLTWYSGKIAELALDYNHSLTFIIWLQIMSFLIGWRP